MESINSRLAKMGLRPVNCSNVMYYYIPMKGCAAYVFSGSLVMAPELFTHTRFQSAVSFPEAALATSVLGGFLYLCSRPHLQKSCKPGRSALALFGSTMFNLGSTLLFAVVKRFSPRCKYARIIMGIGGSVGLLYLAHRYISLVDSHVNEEKEA